jgi:hypothetical protein
MRILTDSNLAIIMKTGEMIQVKSDSGQIVAGTAYSYRNAWAGFVRAALADW